MPILLHEPKDWTYLSEGRKNAVFAQNSSFESSDSAIYERYLLRIPKVDLARAAHFFPDGVDLEHAPVRNGSSVFGNTNGRGLNNCMQDDCHLIKEQEGLHLCRKGRGKGDCTDTDLSDNYKKILSSISFQSKLIRPRLGAQYIDIAEPVQYSIFFLAELRHRTLQQKRIPPSRLNDWMSTNMSQITRVKNESENIDTSHVNNIICYGSLHRNYTDVNSPSNNLVDLERNVENCDFLGATNHIKHAGVPFCIAIEIKPKAGYISTSPLVKPIHRQAKYRHCRFEILQRLMQMGHVKKGWGNINDRQGTADESHPSPQISSYSPIDFFSISNNIQYDEHCVRRSINALFDCPQANLRIWSKPQPTSKQAEIIFGHAKDITEEQSLKLNEYFMTFSRSNSMTDDDKKNLSFDERRTSSTLSHREIFIQNLINIITQIFLQERTLRKNLLSMQKKYDIIDADGAVEVYNRLVYLCDGSHDRAQTLIDDDYFWDTFVERKDKLEHAGGEKNENCTEDDEIHEKLYLLQCEFPFNPPKCTALSSLLYEIKKFRQDLKNNQMKEKITKIRADYNNEIWINNAHKNCLNYVSLLNKNACIWLLQHWLFSLSMCDVSLFATFHPIVDSSRSCQTAATSNIQTRSVQGSLNVNVVGNKKSTLQEIGKFTKRQIYNGNVRFSYQVKVVDCDPKPAKKLASREKYEAVTCYFKEEVPHE